jgi:hypothetical protein
MDGRLTGMVVSFGYLILRQVLQLIVLGLRSERAKEVEMSFPRFDGASQT